MSYCFYCGKLLEDGEVCSCQAAQNAAMVRDNHNHSQGQVRYQKVKRQSSNDEKQLLDLLRGLIKTPADSVKQFVVNARPLSVLLLIGILAVISTIDRLIYIIKTNHAFGDYSTFLFGKTIEKLFVQFFSVAASAALLALILMLIINKIQSSKKVTYIQCLAVASLGELLAVPFSLIGTVVAIIPLKLFRYLSTWVITFGSAVSVILLFIGLKELQENDNYMPITYGIAAVGAAMITSVISLIV